METHLLIPPTCFIYVFRSGFNIPLPGHVASEIQVASYNQVASPIVLFRFLIDERGVWGVHGGGGGGGGGCCFFLIFFKN